MKFKTWIIKNSLGANDPFRDLAYDIKRDEKFTLNNDYDSIRTYLLSRGACKECLETFDEAYEEFLRYKTKCKKNK